MSLQQNQENNQNLTEPGNTISKNIDNELTNISKCIDKNPNLDYNKIIEYNNLCAESILEEKIELPKDILSKIEIFLEANVTEIKLNLDRKILIIILHNLACCYQKIKDFENCISYLEAVIYHFDYTLQSKHNIKINEEYFIKNMNVDQSNYTLLGDFILELRFSAKFHLQMCAVLSQANKHIEALKHAKLATLMCEDNLVKTNYLYIQISKNSNLDDKIKLNYKIIKELYNRIFSFRNGNNIKNNNNNNNRNINNIIENENNFSSYLNYQNNEINKYISNNSTLNNIRQIFGNSVEKEDWIQMINIGNIMYLSPLNYDELELDSEPKYELLRDAILEKIIMLTVSYFCIANELRFLSKDKENNNLNGEFYHYKAVDLSCIFLPVSCPIIKHYIFSYYKNYGNGMNIIPEDKIAQIKIDLIRSEIEQDKDTLTFIRSKNINYVKKIILNENINHNHVIKRKNEQRCEIIPNSEFAKSKIKGDNAPKFKLNFNNLRDNSQYSLKENNSDRIKMKKINNNNSNHFNSLIEKNEISGSKTERIYLNNKNNKNNKKINNSKKTNRYISVNNSHNHTNNNISNNSKGNITARIGNSNKNNSHKNFTAKGSKTQRDYFHSTERIFSSNINKKNNKSNNNINKKNNDNNSKEKKKNNNNKKISCKTSRIQSSKLNNKNNNNNIKNNYNNNIIKGSNLIDKLLNNSLMQRKNINKPEKPLNNIFSLIKVLEPKNNHTNIFSGNNKNIKKSK